MLFSVPQLRFLFLFSFLGAFLFSFSLSAAAPDAEFALPKRIPKKIHMQHETPAAEEQSYSDVDWTGSFSQAFKSKKPLEGVNPFAPASAGYNKEVSHNLNQIGKNEGIILFGIRW